MSFSLTDEQNAFVAAYKSGDNIVGEAFAGAAKTSTTVECAKTTPDETLGYFAYNKSIATEAKGKFPRNVEARTAHSFAFGAVGKLYSHRLKSPRMTMKQLASNLKLYKPFELDADLGLFLKPSRQASLVNQSVARFCYSADPEPSAKHVPFVPGAEGKMDELAAYLLPAMKVAWEDALNLNGRLRFTHDMYLKMWQLGWNPKTLRFSGPPKLGFDALFYDEAQDANPCNTAVVLAQDNCQLIAVGDRYQAIYGWRGAEDAIQNWPADQRLLLTKSFRFGQAIADEANKWLELLGAPAKITGFEQVDSKIAHLEIDEADAVLCRTNAGVMSNALEAIERGKRVAIVGGTNEIRYFAEAVRDLRNNGNTDHPDLAAFQSWDQVKEYVAEGSGSDLKVLVTMVDDYGVEQMLSLSDRCVEERDAEMILSTAHKSKGREWKKVKIGNDFTPPTDDEDFSESEAMLAYVSVTRAQEVLDPEGLSWVNSFLANRPPEGTMQGMVKGEVNEDWEKNVTEQTKAVLQQATSLSKNLDNIDNLMAQVNSRIEDKNFRAKLTALLKEDS